MQKWEYRTLTTANNLVPHGIPIIKFIDGKEIPKWKNRNWWLTQALEELGKDGWELIQVVWRNSPGGVHDTVYYLKRPV